jgi:hypothetical protein
VANDPDVRGKRGNPNIWPMPADVHRDIHPAYNDRFIEELGRLGNNPCANDIVSIRDSLVKEFGIEKFRPKRR